jgi:hypothetical protein
LGGQNPTQPGRPPVRQQEQFIIQQVNLKGIGELLAQQRGFPGLARPPEKG